MASNRFLIVFFLVAVFLHGYGQKIDSLKTLLPTATGVQKSDILKALSLECFDRDPALAKHYGLEAFNVAKKINDSLRIVKTGRVLSSALRDLGRIDSSIVICNEILPIAELLNDPYDLIFVLNSFGLSYTFDARYDKALEYYMMALNLTEKNKDTLSMAWILPNIGLVYYKIKDYDRALVYFKQCLEIKRRNNDLEFLDVLLLNISASYAYKNDFVAARHYVDLALNSCFNNCSDEATTQANFNLGLIFFGANNFNDAKKHFLKSHAYAKRRKDIRFQFDNIDYLVQISFRRNEFDQALEYLKEAEKLIKEGAPYNLEVIKIYAQFLKVYSLTKNYQQATYYQQKYIQLKDSIYSEELTANLMKVEAEYQERENKAKIASQNDLLVLKEQVIANQNLLNVAVFSMVIVLVVLAVILFRSNRQRKAINRLLELKVKERTKTLELDQAELIKACEERDLLLEKTVRHVRISIGSITGICENGMKNLTDVRAMRYFQEAKDTSNALSNTLHTLQGGNQIVT